MFSKNIVQILKMLILQILSFKFEVSMVQIYEKFRYVVLLNRKKCLSLPQITRYGYAKRTIINQRTTADRPTGTATL